MTSEMHIEAQRLEEMKTRKKRIKPRPAADTQKENHDPVQPIQEPPPPTTPNLNHLASPPKSRQRAHNSREDPIEKVCLFLTEMPNLD